MRSLALLSTVALDVPALATTFTVNNTADISDATPGDGVCETAKGNGVCTLREPVQDAGALTGAQTIAIPAGTYTLSTTPLCASTQISNHNVLTRNVSSLCVKGNVIFSSAEPVKLQHICRLCMFRTDIATTADLKAWPSQQDRFERTLYLRWISLARGVSILRCAPFSRNSMAVQDDRLEKT